MVRCGYRDDPRRTRNCRRNGYTRQRSRNTRGLPHHQAQKRHEHVHSEFSSRRPSRWSRRFAFQRYLGGL